EIPLQHHLIQVLELGKREFLGQKLESDGLVAQLLAQAVESQREDFGMVERQARHIMHSEPSSIASVRRRLNAVFTHLDESVVRNGDDRSEERRVGKEWRSRGWRYEIGKI